MGTIQTTTKMKIFLSSKRTSSSQFSCYTRALNFIFWVLSWCSVINEKIPCRTLKVHITEVNFSFHLTSWCLLELIWAFLYDRFLFIRDDSMVTSFGKACLPRIWSVTQPNLGTFPKMTVQSPPKMIVPRSKISIPSDYHHRDPDQITDGKNFPAYKAQ